MRLARRLPLLAAAAILCALTTGGSVTAADSPQILIESRFLDVADYGFEKGVEFPYVQYDRSFGMKFKTGKKLIKNGEKFRGVQMKAKQDNAAGFFSLGQRFSASVPITVSGTYQLRSMKGLRAGSTIGIEIDSPFVPVGGQFDNFIFAGVEYVSGGLRGFTNHNGSNVGSFPVFTDTTSLDLQIHLDSSGVTVDIKPTEETSWSNLVTDYPFVTAGTIGVGVGMSRVDKGAKAVAGCIRIEGAGGSIYADPTLTTLLGLVDLIRDDLANGHEALLREDSNGDPDPDIPMVDSYLTRADGLHGALSVAFEDAVQRDLLDPDTPVKRIRSRLEKAKKKLDPVLSDLPTIGKLFKAAKRVRKTETLIFVTARLMTTGE